MDKISFLNFDQDPKAVLNPDHENLGYKFAPKLVFPFVTQENFDNFLESCKYQLAGKFETFARTFAIYQVNYHGQVLSLVRPPLGASAAVQLLDWLIAYGVKEVLAIGSCGSITNSNEGEFYLPVKALRDEGTSFHYLAPSRYLAIKNPLVDKVKAQLTKHQLSYNEVVTWTTDGFFREAKAKVEEYLAEGVSVVEMECAAMAACCQMRQVQFAQILYSADSLANFEHDERNWGLKRQAMVVELACEIMTQI